jgi:transposase
VRGVDTAADTIPDDIDALKAALLAERSARREFEARASGAEAMVAHYKLMIAKLQRDRFGASSERGRKLLDQLELQLEELETEAAEDAAAAEPPEPETTTVRPFTRGKPVRAPLPAHLPRERVVLSGPTACPCCGGKLAKLGETITETLECIPRSYKVIQTVREKFSCRACETITQPPAPFHPISRGRAGANLLASVMHGKFLTSMASPPSSGASSDRYDSHLSSTPSNSGCAPNAASFHATTTSPEPWTTCSSDGRRSLACSMTGGFVSPTTRQSARYAASPSGGRHGCSRVQPRRRAGGGDVFADRNREAERR